MIRLYLSLFLTGLVLGAGPCLLSCGPLLFSYIVATKESSVGGLKTYLLFSLTRFFVYCFFGILVGFFGQEIIYRLFDNVILKVLFYFAGVFLFVLGGLLAIQKLPESGTCCAGWRRFFLGPRDNKNIVLFGLVISFSPCVPLVAVLGYIALLADHWLKGILMMASFGLGTVISPMIFLAMAAGSVKHLIQKKQHIWRIVRMLCGVVLAMLGLMLVFTAHYLTLPRIDY